jgi:PAS domain-containing protein
MNDTPDQQSQEATKAIALPYFNLLLEVARESFLILDSDIRVVLANAVFYENFRVTPAETEGKSLYELGNGQWNIPDLKKLLEEILPADKTVKDYEVNHTFETIGEKTMVLNAREIDSLNVIVLAIEDISVRKELEKKLAAYTAGLETKVMERTEEITGKNVELEKMNKFMVDRELKMIEQKGQIAELKKKQPNQSLDNSQK